MPVSRKSRFSFGKKFRVFVGVKVEQKSIASINLLNIFGKLLGCFSDASCQEYIFNIFHQKTLENLFFPPLRYGFILLRCHFLKSISRLERLRANVEFLAVMAHLLFFVQDISELGLFDYSQCDHCIAAINLISSRELLKADIIQKVSLVGVCSQYECRSR